MCALMCGLCAQDGTGPLHWAAAAGQAAVMQVLVQAGCPLDGRDHALNTPLHLAAGAPMCQFWAVWERLLHTPDYAGSHGDACV